MQSIFFLLATALLSPLTLCLSIVGGALGAVGLYATLGDDLISDSPSMDGLPPADDSLIYHPQKRR